MGLEALELLERGSREERECIQRTREKGLSKGKTWAQRIHLDDWPINLEAAIRENAEEETASRRGEREVSRQSFVEGGRAGSRSAPSRGSRGRPSRDSESTAR